VKCKIVRILPFGAFAEIFPKVDGLIHVSQISEDRIDTPSDVLTIGQEVMAKITNIDTKNGQISLSMRDAQESGGYSSYESDSSFKLGDWL
jgi:4-hydroxy-3-methylbut-2-enyl diphosphate reductase